MVWTFETSFLSRNLLWIRFHDGNAFVRRTVFGSRAWANKSSMSKERKYVQQVCSGSGSDRVVREYWTSGPLIGDSNQFKSIQWIDSGWSNYDPNTPSISRQCNPEQFWCLGPDTMFKNMLTGSTMIDESKIVELVNIKFWSLENWSLQDP